MKESRITIRLEAEEMKELKKLAARMNISTVDLARGYIRSGLMGLDQKHEALLNRLNDLATLVERGSVLSAAAIASSAMVEANKIKQGDAESPEAHVERYRAILKEHVTGAVGAGTDIHRAFGKGKFGT